ncbi:hypothetical protein [Methanococcus maripaludis]|uniref:Uncharacterized protein n=1 Tax=Methanococcus maripaludis TaxID=39152 RepID=A0A2L1C9G9_METMI|nr:hypothetical protein [Methanococcus maripaludis]AVB75959.1 hypothetical protein MMJJ_05420 [Methanococcus maripaludis]
MEFKKYLNDFFIFICFFSMFYIVYLLIIGFGIWVIPEFFGIFLLLNIFYLLLWAKMGDNMDNKISELIMSTTTKIKDIYSVLSENKVNLLFNIHVLVFLNIYSKGVVSNLKDITMVYATLASIIISVTFLIVQLSSSTYGSEIWEIYKNDRYVQYYLVTTPFLILVGLLLVISSSENDMWLNINLLPIFLMFFSIFLIPTYFLHLMDTLKPENILKSILTSIDTKEIISYHNSKSKYNSTDEIQTYSVDMIANIFKVLAKQEQYKALKNCMDLLSGTYFKDLFEKYEFSELKGFLKEYTYLIKKICFMKYPENYEEDIKVSAISGLETIYKHISDKNHVAHYQLKCIYDITYDTIEKYDPNRSLIDMRDYGSEIMITGVCSQTIQSFLKIKLYNFEKIKSNNEGDDLRSIFTYSWALSRELIFKWVKFYSNLDEISRFQIHHTKSRWISDLIEMINKDTFKIIEESENENEVKYLIEYLLNFYREIIITKGFDYKIGLVYLFEKEHKLIANSFSKLIDLLESKNYTGSLYSILKSIHHLNTNNLFDGNFKKWVRKNKYEEKMERIEKIHSNLNKF